MYSIPLCISTVYIFHTIGIVVQDTYSGEVKRKQKDSVAECKNRMKPILVHYIASYMSWNFN